MNDCQKKRPGSWSIFRRDDLSQFGGDAWGGCKATVPHNATEAEIWAGHACVWESLLRIGDAELSKGTVDEGDCVDRRGALVVRQVAGTQQVLQQEVRPIRRAPPSKQCQLHTAHTAELRETFNLLLPSCK